MSIYFSLILTILNSFYLIDSSETEECDQEEGERETHFVKKEERYMPYPPPPQHESYRQVKIGKQTEQPGRQIRPLPQKSLADEEE